MFRWPNEKIHEEECAACSGTGFQPVKQSPQPGRKIFPARCTKCGGKGRVEVKWGG